MRTLRLAVLLVVALAIGAGSADAQGGRNIGVQPKGGTSTASFYSDSWAVVIGVNEYQNDRVPKLRYAVNDARAVSARLEGVEVWLDDQRIGETKTGRALIANNVSEGAHRVRARKAGHRDWEQEIQVAANQRAEVVIDSEPLGPAKIARAEGAAEMVLVPAGEFGMGNAPAEIERLKDECKKLGATETQCKDWYEDWYERESPRHRVTLDAFYIDRYEVTNALFERFTRSTGHRTTAEREAMAGPGSRRTANGSG